MKEPSLSDMITVGCVGTVAFLSLMLFQYFPQVTNNLLNRNEKLADQNIELIKENHELKNKLGESNIFKKLLKSIEGDKYDRSYNNCLDYSSRLQMALRENGIESSIMVRDDRGHAWLGVWIESTSGDFVPINTGWDILELRDYNLNVIK